MASRAGLDDRPDVPSLALGSGLVTPLAITAAFAVFSNGGLAVRPRDISRVRDADGGTAFEQPVDPERVISPEVAFQMVSMLRDAIDRGTGARARQLGIRFPAGGKTGTTNEFKDAWFVGFSSSVVAGVWVGFDQPQTHRRGGVRLALRAADLGRFHAACGTGSSRRGVRAAWRAGRRDAVQPQLSQARGRLPDLHGVLQGRRRYSRSPSLKNSV